VGMGMKFITVSFSSWVGLGWVEEMMGWVGLGYGNWTHGHVCAACSNK